MVRTQIQLTREQRNALRTLANGEGISMAEAIRRCVDRSLAEIASGRESDWQRASALVGRFRDRARDVARKHDRHLADAFR